MPWFEIIHYKHTYGFYKNLQEGSKVSKRSQGEKAFQQKSSLQWLSLGQISTQNIMQTEMLENQLTIKQISHSLNKTLNKLNNPLKFSGSAPGVSAPGWQGFAFSHIDYTKRLQLRQIFKL